MYIKDKLFLSTSNNIVLFAHNIKRRIISYVLGFIIIMPCMSFTALFPDEIPVAVKIPIFLKVLSFDRQIKLRAVNNLNMLIVYQGNYKYSKSERDEIENVLDNLSISSVDGIPIEYFYADIDDVSFPSEIDKRKIDYVLVCPLRGISISNIVSICREKKTLSFADISLYTDYGLSVGVEMKSAKPQIIINLKGAKAEGAEFSSQLLKLSRVIE